MKKDEIIELLKEQLRVANDTVSSLTTQVNELIERIKSLEELLVQKGIAIDKANRQNKALGKLVSGKKSERQEKNPQASMTQEEFDKKKTEQAEKRKARKNNGAKRDMHYEMKEVHVTIDPVMDAGLLKTLRLFGTRTCIRYSMEPIKFIKTVYHINTYTDGSIMYPGKTPPALLLNSSYSSNPQPIGFSGILLAKRQNSFYCTYFLHNRNVADTKSPYPIKRLEVIRWFNQKSMVFNQSLS